MMHSLKKCLGPVNLIMALVLLLVQIIIWLKLPHLNADSSEYLTLANSIYQGKGFVTFNKLGEAVPNLIRSPGYPLFLAFMQLIHNNVQSAAIVAQLIITIGTIFLFFRHVYFKYGNVTLFILQVFCLITPTLFAYTGTIVSESLSINIMMLILIITQSRSDHKVLLLACGLMTGFLVLLRYNTIFLVALVPLFYLINYRSFKSATIVFAGTMILLLPWTYRNYHTLGKLTPVPTFSSDWSFYTYIENYYGVSVGPILSRNEWPAEPDMSQLRSEVEEINIKIGVPRNSNLLYFWGDTTYNTLDLQVRAAHELSLLKQKKLKDVGLFDFATRRVFLMSPLGWFTKSYPSFIPPAFKYLLIASSVAILIVAILSLSYFLNTHLLKIIACFVCSAYLVCFSLPFAVILPNILYVYLSLRKKLPDKSLLFPIIVFYHYALIPMFLHLESRYTMPARAYMFYFTAIYLSTFLQKIMLKYWPDTDFASDFPHSDSVGGKS